MDVPYSATSVLWPSRSLSVLRSEPAASAITVPGGKIASAPDLVSERLGHKTEAAE